MSFCINLDIWILNNNKFILLFFMFLNNRFKIYPFIFFTCSFKIHIYLYIQLMDLSMLDRFES